MIVSLIPSDHVEEVWPKVQHHMERAAEYTFGRYDVNDIKDSITQYDHDLWIAFDDDKVIKGAVVTTFKHYPKAKYLDMVFIGGDDGLAWKDDMLKMLQHWAYDNNCDGIESTARFGWAKIFKEDGYKPVWQTFVLPIADSGLRV